ncbi:hypothetical protein V6N13_030729 [Hibiscus sabdariffa]
MTSAPKGALDAINAHQKAQHATSTHGAAREAICSMLGCTMPSDLARPLVLLKLPQPIWQEDHQVNVYLFDFL